jgi:2C-methyl-D-erythritol 2,4-cyclodiphosphate synthase
MSLAGIGYDSHRLAPGAARLILGGVEIPVSAAWRVTPTPMC